MINEKLFYNLEILTKACMAYFLHETEKSGVFVSELKPTCNPTLKMVGNYFSIHDGNYAFCNAQNNQNLVLQFTDTSFNDDMAILGIEDFMKTHCFEQLNNMVETFCLTVNLHPNNDIIFSKMLDLDPFSTIHVDDPDSGMRSRAIFGLLFGDTTEESVVIQFDYLLVDRYRDGVLIK